MNSKIEKLKEAFRQLPEKLRQNKLEKPGEGTAYPDQSLEFPEGNCERCGAVIEEHFTVTDRDGNEVLDTEELNAWMEHEGSLCPYCANGVDSE